MSENMSSPSSSSSSSLMSSMSVLVVSDLSASSSYLMNTFGPLLVESPLPSSSSSSDALIFRFGEQTILLVKASFTTHPHLHPSNQLIIAVEKVDEVADRAVKGGGCVVEESVSKGTPLYVIRGPPSFNELRIILLEKEIASSSSSASSSYLEAFVAWCLQTTSSETAHYSSVLSPSLSSSPAEWNPPPGIVIPTIFPSVLHNNTFENIEPNSSSPIPFRTEYFEGEVLLLVRTTPLAPRYRHIFQKVSEMTKRAGSTTFEVQCQGRFLKKPEGMLYIGAEITKKMNLGMFTRGLCYTILQFVNSINPFIHSSFGDKDNRELPHLTGPLWSLADKVIITPAGHTPPKLGQVLPEEKEARAKRRGHSFLQQSVDLESTYSFSVNTDNIELCDWNVVNIPLMNTMDLHTFWDDADIRLCCYCVPSPPLTQSDEPLNNKKDKPLSDKTIAKALPKHHEQASNQYLMCVQLEHLSNHPGRSPNSAQANERGVMVDQEEQEMSLHESFLQFENEGNDLDDQEDDGEWNEDMKYNRSNSIDDDMFFDTQDGHDEFFSLAGERTVSRSMMMRSTSATTDSAHSSMRHHLVPAAMTVSDVVRKRSMLGVGSRRELYLFCLPQSMMGSSKSPTTSAGATTTTPLITEPSSLSPCLVTIQSYKEFESKFDIVGCYGTNAYSRMSKTEQRRLDLQNSMVQVVNAAKTDEALRSQLVTFMECSTHTQYFLLAEQINAKNAKNGVGNPRLRADLGSSVLVEGYVCFRQGQSHWSEEYLCLTAEELVFIKHSPRLAEKKRRRIPLEDILSFKVIDSRTSSFPLDDCYCILFSTFPREFSVLVRGSDNLNKWMTVLPSLVTSKCTDTSLPLANSFKQLELFSRPKDWKFGTRVFLNGRRFCGRGVFERADEAKDALSAISPIATHLMMRDPSMDSSSVTEKTHELSEVAIDHTCRNYPVLLVERALLLVAEISVFSNSMEDLMGWDTCLEKTWILFLNVVSLLPCINLGDYELSSNEEMCIFLNLYHTMLLHAVLVAGVPSTVMKWPSFFNSFSYEAFGDIFCLSELEHSIVKGGFNSVGLIPQLVIRRSSYDFPFFVKDFRLLFALNCGSFSMPDSIPIFRPDDLEDQLDNCVRKCLHMQLHISRGSGNVYTVKLPLLCQWYSNDVMQLCDAMEFSSEYKNSSKILRLLVNYSSKEQKEKLLKLITDTKSSYSFKYSKFEFRCRLLKLD